MFEPVTGRLVAPSYRCRLCGARGCCATCAFACRRLGDYVCSVCRWRRRGHAWARAGLTPTRREDVCVRRREVTLGVAGVGSETRDDANGDACGDRWRERRESSGGKNTRRPPSRSLGAVCAGSPSFAHLPCSSRVFKRCVQMLSSSFPTGTRAACPEAADAATASSP